MRTVAPGTRPPGPDTLPRMLRRCPCGARSWSSWCPAPARGPRRCSRRPRSPVSRSVGATSRRRRRHRCRHRRAGRRPATRWRHLIGGAAPPRVARVGLAVHSRPAPPDPTSTAATARRPARSARGPRTSAARGDRARPPRRRRSTVAPTVGTRPSTSRPRTRAGHVAAAAVDAGHQLLARVAALGEADRGVDEPLAQLGGDGGLGDLGAHRRHARLDAQGLQGAGLRVRAGRVVPPSGPSTSSPSTPGQAAARRWLPMPCGLLGAGAAQRDPEPGARLELGLRAQLEAAEPGEHRLAPARVDVEEHVVVGEAGDPEPGVDLAGRLEQERRRRRADGEAGDVLAQLALEELDRLGAVHHAPRRARAGAAPNVRAQIGAGHGRTLPGAAVGPCGVGAAAGRHAAGGRDGRQEGPGLVVALEVLVLGDAVGHDARARPAPTPARRRRPRACGWRWPCRCCRRSRGSRPPRRRARASWARARR